MTTKTKLISPMTPIKLIKNWNMSYGKYGNWKESGETGRLGNEALWKKLK